VRECARDPAGSYRRLPCERHEPPNDEAAHPLRQPRDEAGRWAVRERGAGEVAKSSPPAARAAAARCHEVDLAHADARGGRAAQVRQIHAQRQQVRVAGNEH